jgi:hypothetical protein
MDTSGSFPLGCDIVQPTFNKVPLKPSVNDSAIGDEGDLYGDDANLYAEEEAMEPAEVKSSYTPMKMLSDKYWLITYNLQGYFFVI